MRKTDSNLVPQSKRTKDEQRKIARMGGRASGAARRRKRTLRQCLLALRDAVDAETGLTGGESWAVALARRAEQGDVQAFKLILETLHEQEPLSLESMFESFSGVVDE